MIELDAELIDALLDVRTRSHFVRVIPHVSRQTNATFYRCQYRYHPEGPWLDAGLAPTRRIALLSYLNASRLPRTEVGGPR